ncbi:MAG: hypothetical protein II309_00070 [Bacilli bacterium]|nr:hypothetical protein [Bacilli bacterium]
MRVALIQDRDMNILEEKINNKLEELNNKNLYILDVELSLKHYTNQYIALIKYQEKVKSEDEEIVSSWLNKSCLD